MNKNQLSQLQQYFYRLQSIQSTLLLFPPIINTFVQQQESIKLLSIKPLQAITKNYKMNQFKGKKMTFDEYQHNLSSKPNNSTNKSNKKPMPQPSKQVNQKPAKIITTVKQQYAQKPFKTTNGRSNNLTHSQQSQMTHIQQSNMTIINQSSFSSSPLDSYSEHSTFQAHKSHLNNNIKTHEVTRQSIPAPISHTSHANKQPHRPQSQKLQPISNKLSQQVNKIDLIFEKQPEDVQKKLRMLLLNYNAVMQYNQDEDKFEVDLLLPFNTLEEKQLFVQKFMKTRHYLSQQIQTDKHNHQGAGEQQGRRNHYSSHHPGHQYDTNKISQNKHALKHQEDKIHSQYESIGRSNDNSHPSNHHSNNSLVQNPVNSTKKSPNQSHLEADNILSTSLREEAQKIHQQKQLKQTDHKIDFFTLSQSLDLSIQRGLTLIKQQKNNRKQNNFQTHKISSEGESYQSEKGKIVQEKSQNEKHDKMEEEQQAQIQRTQSHSRIQQQSHVNEFREPASEIESQISQGHKPGVPQSTQRNFLHTPSGKKEAQGSAWMKPLQPNESQGQLANSSLDYSQQEYSRMIKPTGNSLYESPIAPMKNQDSFDRNNTSNQILIEDLENYYDVEGYQTPDKGTEEYEMEQESYNSAFDMIEETAQQHEDEHFPSSLEYKEFLKNKIHDTNIRSGSKQKNQSKYLSSFSSKETIYPREGTSSLRAKYSEFLSKNHKKIESLYLRIGRQMRKKKQQQQNQQTQNASYKHRQQAVGQILVADDQIDEINDKEENLLEGYKKRIVLENDSMSSQDKVRYFRYLAKHAKGLYIDFIKNHHSTKRNIN